jgi:carboxyl-terminal processing protease
VNYFIIGLSLIAFNFTSIQAHAADLACQQLPGIFESFKAQHFVHPDVPQLEKPAVAKFVELLDPGKTELLQTEADQLTMALPQAFTAIANGDCGALNGAMGLIIKRAEDDLAFAEKTVGDNYKLDESVQLTLDPKKRGYMKTQDERMALLRKLVNFQVANYLNSGLALDAAKKQLVHHYQLSVKRLKERQEKGSAISLFADAYAEAVDPHSSYMPGDAFANFQISMRLSLEGIGATLGSRDGFTEVEALVPGGQADKTGKLRAKDKIVAVAQKNAPPVSTIDMDLDDVVRMIRGPKGTPVTLSILREGAKPLSFQLTIIRDKIDVSSQAAKITYQERKIGDHMGTVGIIDLPSFYGGDEGGRWAARDIAQLLSEAKKKKVEAIVLDLSRNGGGLLEEAVRISGLFIKKGGVVGTLDSRGKMEVLDDEDTSTAYAGPLVVLTSGISASASEILAGALQDYHRALIVGGTHTFGKGTIQQLMPLPAQLGAIKVTVGMFFLPSGQSTQQKGVSADIVVPTVYDSVDLTEAKLDHSLPPQKLAPFLSSSAIGDGPARWSPVTDLEVSELAQRSQARRANDPGFAKLQKKLVELKAANEVKISELRKKGKVEEGDDEFKAFDKITLDEAVSIAADEASMTPPMLRSRLAN